MSACVVKWLAGRDTGISSKVIAFWLGFSEIPQWSLTPADPSDLGRCLRLLEACPDLKLKFHRMAELGGLWPTFVARWDEMAASMESEVGIDWSKGKSAPKTYELMKHVETEAWAAVKARGQ